MSQRLLLHHSCALNVFSLKCMQDLNPKKNNTYTYPYTYKRLRNKSTPTTEQRPRQKQTCRIRCNFAAAAPQFCLTSRLRFIYRHVNSHHSQTWACAFQHGLSHPTEPAAFVHCCQCVSGLFFLPSAVLVTHTLLFLLLLLLLNTARSRYVAPE